MLKPQKKPLKDTKLNNNPYFRTIYKFPAFHDAAAVSTRGEINPQEGAMQEPAHREAGDESLTQGQ